MRDTYHFDHNILLPALNLNIKVGVKDEERDKKRQLIIGTEHGTLKLVIKVLYFLIKTRPNLKIRRSLYEGLMLKDLYHVLCSI